MIKKIIISLAIAMTLSCSKQLTEVEVIEQATKAISENDHPNAQVYLKNYLVEFPQSSEIRALLASSYTLQGNFIEAVNQFERSETRLLSQNQVERMLEAYYFTGDVDQALETAALLNSTQLNQISRLFIAINQLRQTQNSEELTRVTSSSDLSTNIRNIADATIAFYDNEDPKQFLSVVEGQIQDNELSNNWYIVSLLANISSSAREFKKSAQYFEILVEQRPQYLEPKLFLAEAFLKSAQLEQAELHATEILQTIPKQPVANYVMAMVELEKRNWVAANDYFQTSIIGGYTSRTNYLLAGAVNYRLGNYQQAITYLERGLVGMKHRTIFVDLLFQAKAFSQDPESAVQVVSDTELSRFADFQSIKNVAVALHGTGAAHQIPALFERIAEEQALQGFEYELFKSKYTGLDDRSLSALESALTDPSSKSTIPSAQAIEAQLLVLGEYYKNGDIATALSLVEKWYQDDKSDVSNVLLYADALQRAARFEDALTLLSPLTDDTDNAFVHKLATRSFFELKKMDDALASAKKALEIRKYDLNLLRQYAYIRTVLNLKEQEDLWISSIYSEPALIESQAIMLSMYYQMMENNDAALNILTSIETSGERSVVYYYTLAETYLLSGNTEQAKKSAFTASRETVIPYSAISDLLITLVKLNEVDEAISMLKRQGLNYPASDEIRFAVADLLMNQKQDLEQAYIELNGIKSNKSKSMSLQSDILFRQGKLKQGRAKLLQAYNVEKNKDLGLRLAATYLRLNEVRLATNLVSELQSKYPNSIDVTLLKAEMSKGDDAIKLYKKVIAVAPDNGIALNNLAWQLLQVGKPQEGLAYAQKAVSLSPTNVNFADTLEQINQAIR